MLQAMQNMFLVPGTPRRAFFAVPFPRHSLEGLPPGELHGHGPSGLAFLSGVKPLPQHVLDLRRPATRFLQAHGGIHAKGKSLFFSGKTVLDTPPLAPTGGNLDIQTFAIRQLVAFSLGFAARMAASVNIEGHGGNSRQRIIVVPCTYPHCCPHFSWLPTYFSEYGRPQE